MLANRNSRRPACRLQKSASIFAVALVMLSLIIPTVSAADNPQYIEITDEYTDNEYYSSGSSYYSSFATYDVPKFKRASQSLGLIIHRDIGDISRIIFGSSNVITTSADRSDQTSVDFYYDPDHEQIGSGFPPYIDRSYYVGSGTLYIYSNSATNEGHMTFVMDEWDSSVYANHPNEQVFCHAELARNLNFDTIELWRIPSTYSIIYGDTVAGLYAAAGSSMVSATGNPLYVYTDGEKFRQKITYYNIDDDYNSVEVSRLVDGKFYQSTVTLSSQQKTEPYYVDDTNRNTVISLFPTSEAPYDISVYSPVTTKTYNYTVFGGDSPTPTPTEETTVLRKGSVIMTDHNGTSITGFEVTAVNAYTNEAFTVTTDTDVAVMNLPMDRMTEIRNPQTGVYEEAPVGYYRFYGQKPGYKMLLEEGIKVSVLPEKYDSYKLCNILVTSDTGPLTGKHQFQLRSWSDNSILQTGTISAKSATTGIWYNTTVTNGIATLVLPYDTSDALSEYAGHYFVYATSPGYEDNNYGVQIAVYPRTVSEVKWIHLTPIGGVPTPGNVTLRIQAISETGQGVPNAEIFIAGVIGAGKDVWDTYTTSWTGFIEVSVPGNSTYDIVARGVGYYDSSRRIEVFTEDPPIIEMRLYLSGAPTIEPTTEPTGWVTGPPTTQPTGGIPDEDDGSGGFLMEAVRGIGNVFGVGFATAKIILGMLLALSIGFATAKQLRGGAAEFGLGLLGGTMLGILVGLIPVWTIVVLLLVVGLYIGNRYVGGGGNNG